MGRGSEQPDERVGAVIEGYRTEEIKDAMSEPVEKPKRAPKVATLVEVQWIDAGPRLRVRYDGLDITVERGQAVPLPKNAVLVWK